MYQSKARCRKSETRTFLSEIGGFYARLFNTPWPLFQNWQLSCTQTHQLMSSSPEKVADMFDKILLEKRGRANDDKLQKSSKTETT